MNEPGSRLDRLFQPVDAASIAVFRIGFGLSMLYGVWRWFAFHRIGAYFIEPSFHFTYYGFGWVRPWPPQWMYVHFIVLGVLAVTMTVGLWYRLSTALYFLGFSYVFLLEKARYLNHYYLVILLCFLLIFVPAHRSMSLDARKQKRGPFAPYWALFLLRSQIGLVYFYAAVAKMNWDWLRAQPLKMWLGERASYPVVGELLAMEPTAWLFSYSGLLLDLFAWPFLAWRRTRVPMFISLLAFHLMNSFLFNIGIFPWLMIAASTIFFEPDWPRRLMRMESPERPPTAAYSPLMPRVTATALYVYLGWQMLMPLRHFLYPGNVSWTEEGHNFAWHMKLRDKESSARFIVRDADTGAEFSIDPREELTYWQARKMSGRPDMLQQFAAHLANRYRENRLVRNPEVRVIVRCSLNGRDKQLLIDPTIDLAKEPRGFAWHRWIVPLTIPLEE